MSGLVYCLPEANLATIHFAVFLIDNVWIFI